MNERVKTAVAAAQSGLFATSALLAVPMAAVAQPGTEAALSETSAAAVQSASASAQDAASIASAPPVVGRLTYTQEVVTPNDAIRAVFRGAVAALCSGEAEFGSADYAVEVSGEGLDRDVVVTPKTFSTPEKTTLILGCTCAANIPGGGASINAEVTGVPFEQILQTAGAR